MFNSKEVTTAIQPVTVTMIGSGTGDGGAPILNGSMVRTPDHQANIIIKTITPLMVILVRSTRVFLQTLVALLGAATTGMAPNTLPVGDFGHLLVTCAGLSVAAAAVCAIQNLIELLAKIDQSFPTLRA